MTCVVTGEASLGVLGSGATETEDQFHCGGNPVVITLRRFHPFDMLFARSVAGFAARCVRILRVRAAEVGRL